MRTGVSAVIREAVAHAGRDEHERPRAGHDLLFVLADHEVSSPSRM